MHQARDLTHALLDEQQEADHLDATPCRTGATTDKTGKQQQYSHKTRPVMPFGRGEAGRSADGHRLKKAMHEVFVKGFVSGVEVQPQRGRQHHQHHEQQVEAEFRILPVHPQVLLPHHRKMQGKIDTCQKHENHAHQIDGGTVEIAHTGIVGGKTADGDGGKSMADGIEQGHACQPVAQATGHGQPQIDIPQRLGRFGDARCELGVFHGTGCFRPVQLHAADTQHGQYSNGQHNDTHAPQPLELLTVVKDGTGQIVQPHDHRCAGGGQTGNGFEECIRHGQAGMLGQRERQSAGGRKHRPEHDHHHEAVTQAQFTVLAAHRQPAQGAKGQGDAESRQKGRMGAVVISKRHQYGRQHGKAENHQQQAQNALYHYQMHGASLPGDQRKVIPT